MKIKKLFKENKWMILFLIISVAIYIIMLTVTIPTIRQNMGGIEIFDLRPMGYSVSDGYTILNALTTESIGYYKGVQLPLDFIYPFTLTMFSFLALSKLTEGRKKMRYVKWFAFLIMTFDYLENIGIYYLLNTIVQPWMIRITSAFSIGKSMSTTLVMTLMMLLIILSLINKFKKKVTLNV